MTTKYIDDAMAEIRSQFEAADHFKNLWLSCNQELETTKTLATIAAADHAREIARLKAKLDIARLKEKESLPAAPVKIFVVGKGWNETVTNPEDIHHHKDHLTVYLKQS